ncbi:DUF4355 domain-containing protein [Lactiplantibacillus daowaiensis]|uniref:DUF4355 domain-containing protein n=2 Tax=Lactiplantibacillus daowaiensis TaxID=2559918 RepID=A0ABW1RX53_9LACO
MKMKLQYFADPEPDSANSQSTVASAATSSATSAGSAKYTQEDVNRMMAAKASEVEASLNGDLQKQKDDWLAEGEKRAGMSAQEKAEAAIQDQRDALKAQSDQLQARLDAADKRDALATTKEALTDKNIPAGFAEFVSDTNDDVRNANLMKFSELFASAVAKAVDERVKGKTNPQTGSATVSQNMTQADFSKLSLSEQMALATKDPEGYKQYSKQ